MSIQSTLNNLCCGKHEGDQICDYAVNNNPTTLNVMTPDQINKFENALLEIFRYKKWV